MFLNLFTRHMTNLETKTMTKKLQDQDHGRDSRHQVQHLDFRAQLQGQDQDQDQDFQNTVSRRHKT